METVMQDQLDRIEKKLDLILSTFGLRETLQRESAHKVHRMASMSIEELKAESRRIGRQRC